MFCRRAPRLPRFLSVALCVVAAAWLYDVLALTYVTSGLIRFRPLAPLEPISLALLAPEPTPAKIQWHVPPPPAPFVAGEGGIGGLRSPQEKKTKKSKRELQEVQMYAILGALSSKDAEISSVFGSGELLDGGVGGALAADLGEASGAGGLGLKGVGVGGGGTGEGVGIGGLGTLGHGGGGGGAIGELATGSGTGSGYGSGTGRGRLGGAHDDWPQRVQAAIAAHWAAPADSGDDAPIRILLVLNEHGRIVRTRVISGPDAVRESALAALKAAEPFPAPPDERLHNGEASLVVRLER